jgi:hypothetical protein
LRNPSSINLKKNKTKRGLGIFCRFFFGMDRYKNEKPKKQKKKSRGGTVLAGPLAVGWWLSSVTF